MHAIKSFLAASFAVGALIRAIVSSVGDRLQIGGLDLKAFYTQQSGALVAVLLSMLGGVVVTVYFQTQRTRRVKKN